MGDGSRHFIINTRSLMGLLFSAVIAESVPIPTIVDIIFEERRRWW
jgi:hypothetical protein